MTSFKPTKNHETRLRHLLINYFHKFFTTFLLIESQPDNDYLMLHKIAILPNSTQNESYTRTPSVV